MKGTGFLPSKHAGRLPVSSGFIRGFVGVLLLWMACACGGGGSSSASGSPNTPGNPVAPTITTQPQNRTVIEGHAATFSVAASGSSPLSYQWSRGGSAIPGATSSSFTLASPALGDSGASFSVVVSNGAGSAESNPAILTVTSAPITQGVAISPHFAMLGIGQAQTFTATVTGATSQAVTWSASAGAITQAGVYTAPATAGTYQVTAISQADTTLNDTAPVMVYDSAQPSAHPRIYLNGANRARLDAALAAHSNASVRFSAMVDDQLGGGDVYAFEGWFAALMYQLTGDATYGQYAVTMTDTFVASEEALIANAGATDVWPEVAFDSYLYVGDHIGNLAIVYDWCYDLLTPAQRTRWLAYANQAVWNVWHPEEAQWSGLSHPWSGWSIDNPSNNYYYSFLRATMLLGLAEYSEDPAGGDWVTLFRNTKIQDQLVPVFATDLVGGGSREGTGYGVSHGKLFELYDWWQQTTGERICDLTPHAHDSLVNYLHLTVPTLDWVAPVGDHARESTGYLFDYDRKYVEILASMYQNDPIAPYGKYFLDHCSVPEMGSGFEYVYDFLYDLQNVTEKPLSGLFPAYYASGIGQIYTRSSWDTDATWVNLIAGPYTESHGHQDKGSLMVYRNEWLADDQLRRSHSGIRQEVVMHNLVRIEQAGAVAEMDYDATSPVVALIDEPEYTYAAVDITPMYAGTPAVTRVEREMVFIRPSVVVVFDRVEGAANTSRIWGINSPFSPAISGSKATFTGTQSTLEVQRLLPANPLVVTHDWAAEDTDMDSGYRLDMTDVAGGLVSRFLMVLSVDGGATASIVDDSGTLRGVQITLSDGRTATVRFENNTWGGTLQIREGSGTVSLDRVLSQGVETLPLFQ